MLASQFLALQRRSLWTAARDLLVLLGLLLVGCNTSGSSGSLSSSPEPNPQLVQQAVKGLLEEYRTAILQEDIDRLHTLLQSAGTSSQGNAFEQPRTLRQEGDGVFMDAQAFREAMSETFRTRTVTDLQIFDVDIQSSSDPLSVSFLEALSVLEADNAVDPTTLVQRTRVFRTTFRLTRNQSGTTASFRIAEVARAGPLYQVTTSGYVLAGAPTRVEVGQTPASFDLARGEVQVPETGAVQVLEANGAGLQGMFTPPTQLHPQPLLIRLHSNDGEVMVIRHRYRLRQPGGGAVHRIAGTGATRFFAVALASDGTAWFGGETVRPETAETVRVGNVVQVAADGHTILRTLQPVLDRRPNEAVTSARITDIVLDRLERLHFLFLAQNLDERVIGNGDIVLDLSHPDALCQTVNAFNEAGESDPNYPLRVRDPHTGEIRASPSTRAVAAREGNIWLFGSDGGMARVADTFREGQCEDIAVDYDAVLRREDSDLLSNSVLALVPEVDMPRWFGTAIGLQDRQFQPLPFRQGLALPANRIATLEGFFQEIAQAIFEARPIVLVDQVAGELIKGDLIFTAIEDSQGRLWVGTLGNGIRLLEAGGELRLTRDEVVGVDSAGDNRTVVLPQGIGSNVILALAEGPDGSIWAATVEGVSRIQEHQGEVTITSFSTLDGLRPPVWDVAVGMDGTAWLATDGGPFRIVPQGGQVRGVVRDASGDPVMGAEIVVLDTPFRALTDAAGRFILANLPPGPQLLRFAGGLAAGGPFVSEYRRLEDTAGDQILEAVELVPEVSSGLKLMRLSGDEQTGVVGEVLRALEVEVQDEQGNPVSEQLVKFRIIQGTGTLDPAMVLTDDNGQADTILTVGDTAGLMRVEAKVAGLEPVVFTVTGVARDTIRLIPVSGNNQTAAPGEELAEPLVVRLVDTYGNPQEGVTVTAIIEGEAEFLTPAEVLTDTNGEARFRLRVGAVEEEVVRVKISALDQPEVEFLILVGFVDPMDVAVEADGSLVVVDAGLEAVIRVDSRSGERTLVSARSRGNGPLLDTPSGIVVDKADGSLLVVDTDLAAVIRVDQVSGNRTVVSGCEKGLNFEDPENPTCLGTRVGSGPLLVKPVGIAREVDGPLWVVDMIRAAVIRVDPDTGNRTIKSGCENGLNSDDPGNPTCLGIRVGSGALFSSPMDIAVGDGSLLVVDDVFNRVIGVDPSDGKRTVVSGCKKFDPFPTCVENDVRGEGPSFKNPTHITIRTDGSLVVVDHGVISGSPIVIGVNPQSGERTLVSGVNPDTDDLVGSGQLFNLPMGIATETGDSLVVADAGLVSIVRVVPESGDRTIVSSPPVFGRGSPLINPRGLTIDADGFPVVVDAALEVVIRVDPDTGNRTIKSGCVHSNCLGGLRIGDGPDFFSPRGVAVETADSIVVLDRAAIVRVNLESGKRTPVLGDGPFFVDPMDIAIRARSSLAYYVDMGLFPFGFTAVVQVNLDSGERIVVSGVDPLTGAAPQGDGPDLKRPKGIAVEANGPLWVVDADLKAVLQVDPDSGERIPVNDPRGDGPFLIEPVGIAAEAGGPLWVVDIGLKAVVRVDPNSGEHTLISGIDPDTNLPKGDGPFLIEPIGIAAEAGGPLWVVDADLKAVFQVDPNSGDRTIVSRGTVLLEE